MKPPLRTKSVSTKVSEAEFAMLEERARAAGLTLSEWVRDVLLTAPVDGGAETSEVVLAELLALRSLFLNLQFRVAGQAPVTEAEMRGLIERADGVKMQRARERLAEVRAKDVQQIEATSETELKTEAEHGGMGTQGVQQEVAEPDTGVDVDGGAADGGVLGRAADGSV
jgi:hypothetical protein